MSNYSYVVSRSNVSILLTTLSKRTNPPFVANIKDENSTRHMPAITIVNNWRTSIAHSYGRVRHNAARATSFLKPPSRRRGEDCIIRSMTYEQPLMCLLRNLSTCAIPPFVANIQDCNLQPSALKNRATCGTRPPSQKKTFKKYAPTPIAAELFPNFISDVGEVSRPELFEQFCVPIKNSWLLFS